MQKQKILDVLKKIGAYLKASIARNTSLKILSLVFAVLLFIMVMSLSNPDKNKTVRDVPLEITGLSTLNARGLAITNAVGSIPSTVDVRVSVPLKNLGSINTSNTNAQLSVSNIVSTGTHRIPVTVSSRFGSAISTNPSYVEVTVERLATSKLPVTVKYTGTLPEGYRLGTPVLSTDILQLSGAESLLADASYAQIVIDLNKMTSDLVAAVPYQVLNAYGSPISMEEVSVAEGSTLLVDLPVYEVREVALNTENLLAGEVAPGYQITGVTVLPEKLQIAGETNTLNYIESLLLEGVDVTDCKESLTREVDVLLPQGVEWVEETKVTVLITIEEKQVSKTFSDVRVEARNTPDSKEAKLVDEYATVTFTGPKSLVESLLRAEFTVYADLASMVTESSSVPLQIEFTGLPEHDKLQVQIQPQTVSVQMTLQDAA